MRIGISLASAHRVSDPREGARHMVQRARAAREAGLDSLFVGDHHVTPGPYYQNAPILGRLLAEWGDRPAGALFLVPLWQPVLLAEQVATLASIAQGRFILQAGMGYGEEQFDGMGVSIRQRPSRFEQGLDLVRRLLAGERMSSHGRWRFSDARIAPLPPEPVDVWIGASAPVAIERAARLGDGWLAAPGETPERAATQLRRFRETREALGSVPATAAIRRDVYVGETTAEARETTERIVAAGYRGFDPSALVIGDVGQVANAFLELGDAGFSDVIVRNLVPDQPHALACIERLAAVRERVAAAAEA